MTSCLFTLFCSFTITYSACTLVFVCKFFYMRVVKSQFLFTIYIQTLIVMRGLVRLKELSFKRAFLDGTIESVDF